MQTIRNRIVNPTKKKMRKYELDNLSYKKAGRLQVRKEAGKYVYFYWSHPTTYETVKNIMCEWSYGVATIPEDWV